MASILDLMGHVQQQGELGRQRGTESRLARLAGQAYGAPADQRDSFVQQSIATSPQAGFALQGQLQKGDDRDFSELAKAASIFSSIPEEQKGQYYTANIAPLAHKQGFQVPTTYDARFQPALDKIASMAGMGQPGGRVQSTYIDAQGNRVAIMADGSTQVLGQNAPNNQIIDTGNGFYGVNKGNLQAAPVNVGGGQPQGPQAQIPGVYIDPSLPPEVQAQIRQSEATGQPVPEQMYFGGGQQLRSAPKPQAPTELERRLQMAQQMGASPEEQRAIVMGSASTKGPSAAEQKEAIARRAKQPQVANAARGLGRIEQALAGLTGGMVNTGPLDQYATRYTQAGQELEAAVGGIQNSLLSLTRVPGIGSQSDLEARIAAMQYPSLDKDPQVNARTLENLKAFVADLQDAYRIADEQDKQVSTAAPAAPGGWSIQRVD